MKPSPPSRSYVCFVRIPFLFVITTLIVMGIFSRRGWFDWQRIRGENERLETKIAAMQRESAHLNEQIHLLEHDRDEQERVVRQVLGYIRPNETIIEFQ